jgi:hypothetical protein
MVGACQRPPEFSSDPSAAAPCITRGRSGLSQEAIYLLEAGLPAPMPTPLPRCGGRLTQRSSIAPKRRFGGYFTVRDCAGDAPLPVAIRASGASIPQKSSRLAAGKLRSRTRLRLPRRRQDCDPLPNKSCYRSSGRSESGYDIPYQLPARIFYARLRDGPVLSGTSRRSGMLCLSGADMPYSGTDKRVLGHPSRQREATRSDIAHFVP